jgi:predicted kinase
MDNNKYLFLITGAAGSGKSTLAQLLENIARRYIDPISEICEADEFWYILGKGKYAFNPKLLWKAHKWCQDNAREVMSHGANLIVSNTNIKPSDRKAYFDMADEYGYKVVFIHLTMQFQNRHGVPEDAVKRMRDTYTPPTGWELERILKWDDMTDDLKKLLKDAEVDYEF